MSSELLRDLGLVIFAAGAILAFGLCRILSRYPGSPDVALMATIGDAMMVGGACLAVTAMTIGYLAPAGNP